ncbi:MAG: caspase family protein, partial [Saprospiraceae bacterium]
MKGLNLFSRFLPVIFAVAIFSADLAAQCQSGNCQTGTGTYRYSSISTYSGQFVKGLRHGKGKMTLQNGNVYEGQFSNGHIQGQGNMTYTNGDRYVGSWMNDQPNGEGKYFFKTRERYEGQMVNGEFDGSGTMFYTDGAFYIGGWKDNRKNGVGKLVTPDGKTTTGTWNQGKPVSTTTATASTQTRPVPTGQAPAAKPASTKPDVTGLRNCGSIYCRSGQGYYDYPDGSRWIGEFKDGYPNGRGTCHYANGDRYEGEWANNAPYGEGVMYFASGRVYGAVWINGAPIRELDSRETVPADPVRVDASKTVKIWAVIVGVGRYTSMPSLKFTDDDAYRFYSFLKSPEGGALPDNQIAVLVDEDATRANILRTMRQYFLKADANDVVLFYYSGHGIEGS